MKDKTLLRCPGCDYQVWLPYEFGRWSWSCPARRCHCAACMNPTGFIVDCGNYALLVTEQVP